MHTNRLAREKSPYLLQHAHNPVDWFAWNEEAFARARAEDKPIFLSIGYSTCHWCHVMERESFEQAAVAAVLNEQFVSIKVDREERPDVDKIYMSFVQSTTGSGGWPLSVFLTPDLKPFFGGTYFPPKARHDRPGFVELLEHLGRLWRERRGELVDSASEMLARLEAGLMGAPVPGAAPDGETLRRAGALFKGGYDARHGGFGGAPKFPQPSIPAFLLRYAKRFDDPEAAAMVLHTCEAMAAGGIHDQLGGGFARYAVDEVWLVPHFEKMLYDNAQLAQLYLDAYLVSQSGADRSVPQCHADTVRDILDYVLRDMTHAGGGFFSAEDADSEGQEGKFYCWTHAELSRLLTAEEFNVAAKHFGITLDGNFVDHSHPQPLAGLNVLSLEDPDVPAPDVPLLASARQKMVSARAERIRPHLDDKILASWNGLMLGALARASAVLSEDRYRAAAEKNLSFLRKELWVGAGNPSPAGGREGGTLFHRWRDGERDSVQLLEAYAFLLSGVLELYEATLELGHLDFAVELAEAMLATFYDAENGGFWQSAAGADVILRVKDDYDGAEPSGKSVAVLSLLKLGALTGRAEFKAAAEKTLELFADRLHRFPQALPFLLQAVDFQLEEPRRVVLAGTAGESAGLLRAAHAVYQPNKIVLGTAGAVDGFARTLTAPEGATAYLCAGTVCRPPTRSAAELKAMLSEP